MTIYKIYDQKHKTFFPEEIYTMQDAIQMYKEKFSRFAVAGEYPRLKIVKQEKHGHPDFYFNLACAIIDRAWKDLLTAVKNRDKSEITSITRALQRFGVPPEQIESKIEEFEKNDCK